MADSGDTALPLERPATEPEGRRKSFAVTMVFVGSFAAQFLPGPNSHDVRIIHGVSLLLVLLTAAVTLRDHKRSLRRGRAWRFVRWYAVVTMTLLSFLVVVRLAFPIESFAAAPNSVFRRLVAERLLIPSLVLEGVGLALIAGFRHARRSPLLWFTVLLMATVILGPIPGKFR